MTINLFAPEKYPLKQAEIRAYTVAAFRVAQGSDQLSLIAMRKDVIDFLVKRRASGYWKKKGWLDEVDDGFRLTPAGLVVCQSALANELPTHNASAAEVGYWVNQFRTNQAFARKGSFEG